MSTQFGNFSFVKGEVNRMVLEDAFQAMEKVRGSWTMLSTMSDSDYNNFVGPEGYIPMDRVMNRLKYAEHNGSTINWVFYWIRVIAVSGWDDFVVKITAAQNK